jgi:hypothetical protein
MKTILIICFFGILVFVTCKKKDDTKTDTYTPNCTATKSFANDVFPLLKSKCWRCHNDMADYNQVKSLSLQIKDNVISGAMPKDDKLSNDQKNIIVCWVEAGAPNN